MANNIIFCNKCGAHNASAAQFCSNCGSPLAAAIPIARPAVADAMRIASSEAQYVPGMPASTNAVPARFGGFWIRFVAVVIDGILVEALVLPVAFLAGGMAILTGTNIGGMAHGFNFAPFIFAGILAFFGNWIYEASMESSALQATVGKMIFGLKVIDLQGRRISFARATGRHFAKIASSMILCLGYIIAGFTARKQALHDMLASTLVVFK